MYHWLTKLGIRKAKTKRWSKNFIEEEQRHLHSIDWMPSPKGEHTWKSYIENRIAMLEKGMAVYATPKYCRTKLDKYIESNRASDRVAASLTKRMPTIAMIGGANMSPNSPIGIRNRLRCPGTRKLVRSFKKLGNCIVLFVDEYMTSQTCAKCFGRFDPRTKRNRFKVCRNCVPIEQGGVSLPPVIISKAGKRQMQLARREKRQANVNQPVRQAVNRTPKPRLVSKIIVFFKMMLNDAGEMEYTAEKTTNWHRDIVAAKCILYKGMCTNNNGMNWNGSFL